MAPTLTLFGRTRVFEAKVTCFGSIRVFVGHLSWAPIDINFGDRVLARDDAINRADGHLHAMLRAAATSSSMDVVFNVVHKDVKESV